MVSSLRTLFTVWLLLAAVVLPPPVASDDKKEGEEGVAPQDGEGGGTGSVFDPLMGSLFRYFGGLSREENEHESEEVEVEEETFLSKVPGVS